MQVMIDTKQCPCRTLNDECDLSNDDCYEDDICSTCPLIRNGGVKLPKGHGDLIDRRELKKEVYTTTEWNGDIHRIIYEASIDDANPIIKAEKEGEE